MAEVGVGRGGSRQECVREEDVREGDGSRAGTSRTGVCEDRVRPRERS